VLSVSLAKPVTIGIVRVYPSNRSVEMENWMKGNSVNMDSVVSQGPIACFQIAHVSRRNGSVEMAA